MKLLLVFWDDLKQFRMGTKMDVWGKKRFLERQTFKELLQRMIDLKRRLLGEREKWKEMRLFGRWSGLKTICAERDSWEAVIGTERTQSMLWSWRLCGCMWRTVSRTPPDQPPCVDWHRLCVEVKHCGSVDNLGLQSRSPSHYRGIWLTARHTHTHRHR